MLTAAAPQAPYFICHAPNQGVIARYHIERTPIDDQLEALRAAGADGISLSVWLMKKAPPEQIFLDWSDGEMSPQNESNFHDLLNTIKEIGFNWVQIVPQFYGENDFRNWTDWKEELYHENADFLFSLPRAFDEAGLPYLIDVCAEVTDRLPGTAKPAAQLQTYARRIWTDITGWFYLDGVPPWNLSMSFLPDDASIAALPSLFRGLDQSGIVNAPPRLLPHIYPHPGRFAQQLRATRIALLKADLGWDATWILGETASLTEPADGSYADDLRLFVEETRQRIERVCPWPIDVRTPEGTEISVIPQIVSEPWKAAGF